MLPHGRRGAATDLTPGPAAGWSRRPASCSPTASTCSASPPRSGCEPLAHPAGALHAEGADHGAVLAAPPRPTSTRSTRRSGRIGRRGADGVLTVGGVDVRDLAARVRHARRTSSTRTTSVTARRAFARRVRSRRRRLLRRQGVPVHRGRPLGRRGGPLPRRLHRRRARRRAARPASRPSGSSSTATTSRVAELRRGARRRRRPDRRRLVRRDRPARATWPTQPGVRQRVLVRVTVGVEAHTHEFIATAHEDQKFGFSLASGAAAEAVRRVLALPSAGAASACTRHIGSQIFDTAGFEVAAHRVVGLLADDPRRARRRAARARPRRRLRHRLHQRGRPRADVADVAERLRDDRRAGVRRGRPGRAAAGGRARPGDRRPGTVTLYEVGTVKPVDLGTAPRAPTSASTAA